MSGCVGGCAANQGETMADVKLVITHILYIYFIRAKNPHSNNPKIDNRFKGKTELLKDEKKPIQEHHWFIKESFIFSYKVITNSSKKAKMT